MFSNLKAFIRQGRQANSFKDKTEKDNTSPQRTAYTPAQPATGSKKGARQMKEQVPSSPYQDPGLSHQDRNVPGDLEMGTGTENMNGPFTPNAAPQLNYDAVANQIVEEERRQRNNANRNPRLDHYEFLEKLGEGAFSIVYKAHHKKNGNEVAIKVLRKYQMDDAQKQAVLKEVIIMRQLSHPNVVKFIEFIETESYFHIVQELIVGGEIFAAIVKYTYLSEDLSRHIIYQVAKAIRYLHEEVGIVHRDIKPENLLFQPIAFTPSLNPISKLRHSDDPKSKKDEGEFIPGVGGGTVGIVKIADFGLSKQIWEHNTKTPCGTVGYTAPEIVRDERYSKEVDMWAIGCVLYTLLCGFPPFYDERIENLTANVARGEYTFLAPWWDEISAEAKHCVSRLLTVDPKKRYTIDDFFEDPWMKKIPDQYTNPQQYPKQAYKTPTDNNLSRYRNSDLYSPAALALRDAFDISAAVHRAGEEAALKKQAFNDCSQVLEEEEEVNDFSSPGEIPKDMNTQNLFSLDLGGASILGRRKQKPVIA
ncbi:Pkinase-domain-containing protein [Metschnikowia bicuspidata var. bicuspidata NRRL YB-4993]|uniref:Pkinase-domain-containing protein n=1 Tax=Metschnikowia bicuspidata var. bicuspidata NRRL YB-4993 TaxID=869754 RepID=A0A1A0H841_9ASCO|nr:Pkinase-domain-containing protein [Metschnikowia bicuspidata var. bicuspidata NRRL YB-4993]OBA20063.1 Pkinase-domain-containing protein [Metschnikowia bicuspidata var. bicuspidata NRRL YB-4993]